MDIIFQPSTIAIVTTLLIILTTIFYLASTTISNSSLPSAEKPEKHYTSNLVSPISTPTYGPNGSFSVLAKTFIPNSTPDEVLSLIRDTATWSKWNGFTPVFTFSPSQSPSRTSPGPQEQASKAESSDLGPGLVTGKEGWLELGSQGSMSVYMSGNGLEAGAKKSRMQDMVVTVLKPLSSSPSPSPSSSSPQPTFSENEKKGYRIAWKAIGYAHWQLYSERVTELVEIDEGAEGRKGTEYVCWETFGGVLAPVVKLTVGGTLRERFGEYAGGLRGFCLVGKDGEHGGGEGGKGIERDMGK